MANSVHASPPGEAVDDDSYQVLFAEPESELPEPLPTVRDIIDCSDNLVNLWTRKTKRINPSYVAKYGPDVSMGEAENMRFVRQQGVMPVPRVYAVYQRREDTRHGPADIVYIVMEHIKGETLQSVWRSLTVQQKEDVAAKLKVYLTKLRSLPSPSGLIESIGGRTLMDHIFETLDPQLGLSGPFESEHQFISAIVAVHRRQCPHLSHRQDYYEQVIHGVLQLQQPPVFTHNDLQRKNIMLTPEGEVVVVDWGASGWYPPYWEYSTIMFAARWQDDWHHYVSKFLDHYPAHYMWLAVLRIEMMYLRVSSNEPFEL